MPPGRVLALAHHTSYQCRHSGACCTAGWRIPVERERAATIQTRFGSVLEPDHPILRTTRTGACLLFEPPSDGRQAQCALHRISGHNALPSACRHFPRVFLHDRHATRVTLSHFCPTAASLLFSTYDLAIVDAPVDLARPDDQEGLDARDALPPLLHPEMLMDVESYAAWESGAIELLANSGEPEAALARLATVTERVRQWQPPSPVGRGFTSAASGGGRPAPSMPLLNFVREAFHAPLDANAIGRSERELRAAAATRRSYFELACETVPESLTMPTLSASFEDADANLVAPAWHVFSPVLRGYLAGRLFGSWLAYQGRGLRTIVASIACALAVVRIEACRECLKAQRILDRGLLTSAIRQADLLLVHKVDRQAFADRLSREEEWRRVQSFYVCHRDRYPRTRHHMPGVPHT